MGLRHDPANRDCADCGAKGCTMWASVNLGVFLCITCGSHHRSLGTHISKPKGCTGTYWWGPDELENMKTIGNTEARKIYGDKVPTGLTPTSNPMNGASISRTSICTKSMLQHQHQGQQHDKWRPGILVFIMIRSNRLFHHL